MYRQCDSRNNIFSTSVNKSGFNFLLFFCKNKVVHICVTKNKVKLNLTEIALKNVRNIGFLNNR